MATRLERALSERIYLLKAKTEKVKSKTHWEFCIKAQSDRIYKIELNPFKFRCSCPDNTRNRRVCKHIMFIMVRVSGLSANDVGQLESNEGKMTFSFYDTVHKAVNEKLKFLLNPELQEGQEKQEATKEIPEDKLNEPCPICYEDLTKEEKLMDCFTCHHWFHQECMDIWLKRAPELNCPYCRSSLVQVSLELNGKSKNPLEYYQR
jgi:hypothetical protein